MQTGGKRFLVDPVLNCHAGPVSWFVKAFWGSNPYKPQDIPEIDYLFITHDHWDHLDYETVKKLKPKIHEIICPLGVGAHLEYWGFSRNIIHELDWYEEASLQDGFKAIAAPARHFSGRKPKFNQTLWASFVLQTPAMKIYMGGDGGYDKHFAEIGDKYGPIDLAILEQGQYSKNWRYIHLLPDDILKAVDDLKAKRLLPVHNSKFILSTHRWDEPLRKLIDNKDMKIPVLTPKIGEPVNLNDYNQTFSRWWEEVK
jgi:L-ascorbate metabolism protein UlaG (beta-lactamase superfamily)